ncbi:CPBP family intramembrane metalloprotease [Candidatus Dependentiae bacterium]|nr:CPBP family intramembrane metalloprotease [Candidatus Dependentiae bacterium]MBU4387720.1 CPBP family intramembrane metalloprotease [Candidatus Dependentiae bacterium]MCG2755977.1 CPBP family intramembrane metalloprotease [Candidatus Dependentiae bacterium]
MIKKIIRAIGPILISALSVLITFLILQQLAIALDQSFSLLNSRGVGKVAFITIVIFQIILFLLTLPVNFLNNFLKTNLYFLKEKDFIKKFCTYFFIFFILHSILLYLFYLAGFATYNNNWGYFSINLLLKTIFGFFVVFMLAWTEELIFRGTLFPYFTQYFSVFSSLILTSTIFMFVHDLKNPLNLITKNWQLGLGLFLLGMLLNLIFISTKKLYTNMGAHAGLVFVKVILRRAPILIFLSNDQIPNWVNKDLRMSSLVHILFFIIILILIYKNKSKLVETQPLS